MKQFLPLPEQIFTIPLPENKIWTPLPKSLTSHMCAGGAKGVSTKKVGGGKKYSHVHMVWEGTLFVVPMQF